jgi:hypothetical protein
VNFLTANHINELACLNKWLNRDLDEQEGTISSRADKRARVAARFTTLNLTLELEAGADDDDEDSDNEESVDDESTGDKSDDGDESVDDDAY